MTSIAERLTVAVAILDVIDRRRTETGDESLGAAVERCLVDAHLAELANECAVPVRLRRASGPPPRV